MFGDSGRSAQPERATGRTCLQCGVVARRHDATICGRCGLPLGAAPRSEGNLAACPICYRTTDDDGRLESLAMSGHRVDIVAHIAEHDRFPAGDDEYLESLRRGDRIVVGRWEAPFDLVRRYLVTGALDGGRSRATLHNAVVTAIAQLRRWGPDVPVISDQPDWVEARAAVTALLERYHRSR